MISYNGRNPGGRAETVPKDVMHKRVVLQYKAVFVFHVPLTWAACLKSKLSVRTEQRSTALPPDEEMPERGTAHMGAQKSQYRCHCDGNSRIGVKKEKKRKVFPNRISWVRKVP